MHSSRMHTAHLLPISPSMHCSGGCTWSQGVYLVWGCIWSWGSTWSWGGVPGPGWVYLVPVGVPGLGSGIWSWGSTWSWGVYLVLGGCTLSGGCTWSQGVYLVWGVYLVLGIYLVLGGVPGPGGCTLLGGVPGPRVCTWSWGGVSGPGDVPGRGCTCPGTPPL